MYNMVSYPQGCCTMGTKICCFIGRHGAPDPIAPLLSAAVERHITAYGITDFLVGGYGAFDRMAAREGYDGFIYPDGLEAVPRKLAISILSRIMVEDSDHVIAYIPHPTNTSAP